MSELPEFEWYDALFYCDEAAEVNDRTLYGIHRNFQAFVEHFDKVNKIHHERMDRMEEKIDKILRLVKKQ